MMKIYYTKLQDLFSVTKRETKFFFGNEVNVKVTSLKDDPNKDAIMWIKIKSPADNYYNQINYTNDFKISVYNN